MADSIRSQTPEEQELEVKLRELDSLENELADKELTLATLEAELQAFEVEYIRRVGVKYVELDELLAQIAEAEAERAPYDRAKQESARTARQQADESAEATGRVDIDQPAVPFEPSSSMKDLFRKLVKRFHPDKGRTSEQKERYTGIFKAINEAYRSGIEARLRELARELETSPDAVTGDGIAEQLVRAIRMLAQVRRRIEAIVAVIAELKQSELSLLREQVNEAESEGRDLLAEMALTVQREIDAVSHL